MKKAHFWFVCLVLCAGALVPVMAQDAADATAAPQASQDAGASAKALPIRQSDLYVITLPIQKMGVFTKGFIVQYRKTATINKFAYLPLEWFEPTDGKTAPKGELVMLRRPGSWPQMQIFYNKDGTLNHVRISMYGYTPTHPMWGMISSSSNFDKDFENIKNVKPELW
jgi:hypothetical protein